MLHGQAAQSAPDPASSYKTRLGVRMFVVYCLIYGGFVAINILSPALMETEIVAGLNLAVVYGFGLIVVALIMSLIYNRLCAAREAELARSIPPGEGR